MLEGLFSSGFKAKCKSAIKSIKARIELVRKRGEAKQRFLKEDLAKLLVNGLDHDAFSRTEEYLALQNILDSYDFVERTCEYIMGQLSCMQKQRECPEECREAVGSLVFAAARFSDLPELRNLRDLLKERYGNSLECFVSQKFLEKLSSRPPERERKIKLLKDIGSEYSLKWDVKGFEQRMAPPSATTQIQSQARKHGSNLVAPKDHNHLSMQNGSARPNNCEYLTIEKRPELANGVDRMRRSAKGTFSTREDSIPENNEDVFMPRHRHVNDGEKDHSDREGCKRDYTIPQMDRRDATKQRPEFNEPHVPKHRHRYRHVNDSEKKHNDREEFIREYGTLEADERDASRQRPELDKAKDQAQRGTKKKPEVAHDGGKMHSSADGTFHTRVDNISEPNKQDVLRHRHMHVNDRENKHIDREGFIREYSTLETGRRDVTKQRPESDKAKDQTLKGTDVEYLRRNRPVIHNPNSIMDLRAEILLPNGKEAEAADKSRSNYAKEDTCRKPLRSRRSYDTIRSENVDTVMIHNNGMNNIDGNGNSEITQFYVENKMERQEIRSGPNYRSEKDVERLRTDVLGEKSVSVPPYSRSKNSMLPPPYTKPRDRNHRSSRGSKHENSVSDRHSVDPSFHNRDHAVEFSERIQKEADQSKHRKERDEWIPVGTCYPEDFDYDHSSMIPLSKPRAMRRKHRRSLTHENLVGSSEDAGANRRSSSSRRREHLRKGLEVFSGDGKPKGDKEEKIIDKLLLQYCKKPSNYGIEKLRPKANNDHPAEQNPVHAVESSRD